MVMLVSLLLCIALFNTASCRLVSEGCLDCLCQLQTGCDVSKGCDNGVCGPFSITMPYWEDTVGVVDTDGAKQKDPELKAEFEDCTTDYTCSKFAVEKYMQRYKRDCNNDGVIECLDFAAIHVLGPNGCLNTPFPEEKKMFMAKCLAEKPPQVFFDDVEELIKMD